MAFIFFTPTYAVPIALIILIFLVVLAIILTGARRNMERRRMMMRMQNRKMSEELKKMEELSKAVSDVRMDGIEKKPEEVKKEEVKNVRSTPARSAAAGVNSWQAHLSKTYKDMKKKNPKATFQAAMKAAKKTYKKK